MANGSCIITMKSPLFVLGAGLFTLGTQQCTLHAAVPAKPIRGEVIVCRTNAAWESQQVQEPCILPNRCRRLFGHHASGHPTVRN